MLRRHSNPTKKKFGGPGKPSFWSVLVYCFFFFVFLLVLMSFYRFSAVFLRVVAKLLHQKPGKTYFFSETQKLAQNQVLIPRPAFFRDLVDVGFK